MSGFTSCVPTDSHRQPEGHSRSLTEPSFRKKRLNLTTEALTQADEVKVFEISAGTFR
ncbi:hypothetical protein [Paenibacillus herberti]|uniref:hypothetical protein n=1 Tax=Paenibacillus herberti TaxID=1619309 RepID=UPI001595F9E0|nr:hypothetical protein [Paenibacillus herberti]